jgi:hypothetical protein
VETTQFLTFPGDLEDDQRDSSVEFILEQSHTHTQLPVVDDRALIF